MWYSSPWRVLLIIFAVIAGLVLMVIGLRFYNQYRGANNNVLNPTPTSSNQTGLSTFTSPSSTRKSTNTNSVTAGTTPNVYLPTADDDPAIGTAEPTVEIIAFEDFQCPFCREAAPILRQLLALYPDDIRLVVRDFPLYTVHQQAMPAALAAECADEQDKFWAWRDLVYTRQEQLPSAETVFPTWAKELGLDVEAFSECFSSERHSNEIEKDINSGILAGVGATPTFFVNGNKIEGSITLEQWQKVMEQLLVKP